MRNLRNPQLERGEVRIEDIKLNHNPGWHFYWVHHHNFGHFI